MFGGVRELPTGTVTFLFTDVEGSTRLLDELGVEEYARALSEHRRIVRAAVESNDGVEVGTDGDAFFIAFAAPDGAVRAAATAAEQLAQGPLRVRMGLHTGTAYVDEGDYVGMDVHRAARIAACGHGGQVLLSADTVSRVGSVGLRDLGEHRLKDLSAPERIYQLGDTEFPPLKSLHQTNLPIPATPFLGREAELADVTGLLAREDVRIVTLTGPGGTGKTRLALQAAGASADAYPNGVWWVALAPVDDATLVLQAVAGVLGAQGDLAEHIGDKRLLVLLDNFEQVVDAAPSLAQLLERCPRLTFLVTSREPLRIEGEWEFGVDPLGEAEAVALFEQRAQAVRRDFVANGEIRAICAKLDNLPLAIELAAARVKMLSPQALLERLDQRLPVLAGGTRDAPERQRTLRATIEWSHDLLSADEQALFHRISVFAGGADLATVEAVCEADLDDLASLVDKSLVRYTEDRYWLLQTIREYAAEALRESGDLDATRDRHAHHFLALAEEAEPNLRGNPGNWLDRLEREHDNLRAAFDYVLETDDTQLALRFGSSLWRFWNLRGHIAEGAPRLESALARDQAPTHYRALALNGAAALALARTDLAGARARAEEACALHEALGDVWGVANSRLLLGNVTGSEGDFVRAQELYEQSLAAFTELGDEHYVLLATRLVAWTAYELGDPERSLELHHDILGRARASGNRRMEGTALGVIAQAALESGRIAEGMEALLESTRIFQEVGEVAEIAVNLCRLAMAVTMAGNPRAGALLVFRAESSLEEVGARFPVWTESLRRRVLEAAESVVGDAGLEAVRAEATAIAVDDAIGLALGALAGAHPHAARED